MNLNLGLMTLVNFFITVFCWVFTKSHLIFKAWISAYDMWMKSMVYVKGNYSKQLFQTMTFWKPFSPFGGFVLPVGFRCEVIFVPSCGKVMRLFRNVWAMPCSGVYKLWGMGEMQCDCVGMPEEFNKSIFSVFFCFNLMIVFMNYCGRSLWD